MDAWKNQLFFGDNLEILRSGRIPVGSVDLIYRGRPRLQILTIAELFAGKKLEYPQWAPASTFKKAARRRKGPSDEERQGGLL
jgi:hypothetical protein